MLDIITNFLKAVMASTMEDSEKSEDNQYAEFERY
jgi:hypothetical protein